MRKRAIRRKLNTILAKLETMQVEIEEALAEQSPTPLKWRPHDDTENYADLRTYEIMPDGTRRECEE
jgi:hypothetical protein